MPPVKRRGLSGGEDPGEGSTKRPKEVKDGGRRCVVGGCSNNWSNGYTTYNMRTVKLKNVQRGWVKFVDSTRKDFDHKNALTPHVCDGHFTEDSFVQTQKMQYLSGFRSKVPELEKEAVPTIKIATLPHWTMSRMKSNTSTVCSTSTATCAVSVTTTACSITSSTSTATTCTVTMTSPCITTPTTSTMSSRFASSVERNSVIVGGMISTTKVQDTPKSSRPKQIPRRRSNFLVQKELANIQNDLTRPPQPAQVAQPAQSTPLTETKASCINANQASAANHTDSNGIPMILEQPALLLQPTKQPKAIMVHKKIQTNIIRVRKPGPKKNAQPPVPLNPCRCRANKTYHYRSRGDQTTLSIETEERDICICTCKQHALPPLPPPKETCSVETQFDFYKLHAEIIKETKQTRERDEADEDDISDDDDSSDSDRPDIDSDWVPSSGEDESEDDEAIVEERYEKQDQSLKDQKKYIVFEDQLMTLFNICPKCQGPCDIYKLQDRNLGTMLRVKQTCTLCNYTNIWDSQPKIRNTPAGNFLLSAAILFAGASPTKVNRVLKHAGIKTTTTRTFNNHQNFYLQPAVVEQWRVQQQQLIDELKQKGEPLILGGDGRCDSPGRCAKFGTYTLMDLKTFKILDTQLIQCSDTTSSNAMEVMGLRKSLDFLIGQGLKISTLITDRHPSVTKMMREDYPHILHFFDVWHIAKGVKKQLKALGRLKGCEELVPWRKAIISHLYWSACSTPSGDGDIMLAKFRSMLNHVINKHEGHSDHPEVDRCAHGEIEPRAWLKEGTKSYDKLEEIVFKPHLKRALMKMSPMQQTSKLEAFHNVLLFWAPKLLAFSDPGMLCRTYVAVMHWNENGNKEQATREDGVKRYKIAFPKQKEGGHVVKKILKESTYEYVDDLVAEAIYLVETGNKDARKEMPELQGRPAICSTFDRPDKEDAIRDALEHGRFGETDTH